VVNETLFCLQAIFFFYFPLSKQNTYMRHTDFGQLYCIFQLLLFINYSDPSRHIYECQNGIYCLKLTEFEIWGLVSYQK